MNTSGNSSLSAYYGCFSINCLLSSAWVCIIVSFLFLLFVASLIGNVLILVLLSKDRQLRGRSSPSHISLAVADLLATIFWLPFLIIDMYIVEKWVFGHALCKIVAFVQVLSLASSSLNLCIVTAECFAAVWFPFFLRVLPRKRTILITSCAVAWFIAFIDSLVYNQFKTLKNFDGDTYCMEMFPGSTSRELYVYINSSLIGFGPLIIITILNLLCIYRLCQSNTLIARRRHSKGGTYTRSATKKIITISLIFVICRAPLHIFELAALSPQVKMSMNPTVFLVLFTFFHGLYFFSATTHPVLFGLMSAYYREAFIRNCPCYSKRHRRTSTSKTCQTTKILETVF